MSVLEHAILDHDVLARRMEPASVVVPARLDRDAVVPCIERASADDDVPARFRITSVIVGPVRRVHAHPPPVTPVHENGWMTHMGELMILTPLIRTVPATVHLDEIRPQELPLAHDTFVDRHTGLPHAKQAVSLPAFCFGSPSLQPCSGLPLHGHQVLSLPPPSSVPFPVIATSCASTA